MNMPSAADHPRMLEVYEELAAHVAAKIISDGHRHQQYWIAVAGAPASGKSTLAGHVADLLNGRGVRTVVVPMDGYHYYRCGIIVIDMVSILWVWYYYYYRCGIIIIGVHMDVPCVSLLQVCICMGIIIIGVHMDGYQYIGCAYGWYHYYKCT